MAAPSVGPSSTPTLRVTIDAHSRLMCVFGQCERERPVVLLLGAGGAVTYCRGLERPTNCLITTLPSSLARHGRVLAAVMGVLVPLTQALVSACEGGGECWLEEWATALQGMPAAPLDWLPDCADTCSAWSRSVAMGACPVVPHLPLVAPSGRGTASVSRAEAAAWAPGGPVSRAAVLPVLVWTPEHLSVLVPGGGVQGWAWRVMPGPDTRVYQWLWEGGLFTYSRLTRNAGAGLPAAAAASRAARLAVGEAGMAFAPAEMLVRRLLVAAGHVDATAASPLALQCAAASAPEGRGAVVADAAERIEALLGPGPHAFATAAVPVLTAGGALASAARTAACIGVRSQLVVMAVMSGAPDTQQRMLSDSLLSLHPWRGRGKGAAHVCAVGGPPGDASFGEEGEEEMYEPAPLEASMDDHSFRHRAASCAAERAMRANARVLAELSRTLS